MRIGAYDPRDDNAMLARAFSGTLAIHRPSPEAALSAAAESNVVETANTNTQIETLAEFIIFSAAVKGVVGFRTTRQSAAAHHGCCDSGPQMGKS